MGYLRSRVQYLEPWQRCQSPRQGNIDGNIVCSSKLKKFFFISEQLIVSDSQQNFLSHRQSVSVTPAKMPTQLLTKHSNYNNRSTLEVALVLGSMPLPYLLVGICFWKFYEFVKVVETRKKKFLSNPIPLPPFALSPK